MNENLEPEPNSVPITTLASPTFYSAQKIPNGTSGTNLSNRVGITGAPLDLGEQGKLKATLSEENRTPDSNDLVIGTPSGACQAEDGTPLPKHRDSQPIVSALPKANGDGQSPKGRSTGPRSEAGKRRSSRNSTKYGIFSDVIVLPGESRKQFLSMLERLGKDYEFHGGTGELLVEKLAMISWRLRRLQVALGAEILKDAGVVRFDRQNRKQEEAEGMSRSARFEGEALTEELQNPKVLEYCLELLVELRQTIESEGFKEKENLAILTRIYGSEGDHTEDLQGVYTKCFSAAGSSEEERKRDGWPSREICKQEFLDEIDREMRHLRRDSKRKRIEEADYINLKFLQNIIPASRALDRFLRYEASLERSFERTLVQLERLEQRRKR